jgi:bifunctional N-acetylglucosamine-1-phosphate-uridyltransferase/glucosamine-1-phosphate-acetyltransferase GlmU-like protein
MAEQLTVLVMAAGQGTRMRSSLPKVLHPICGKPMVEWVVDAARAAGATEVVCVTRPGDGVADGLPAGVAVVEQTSGEGTGSAVLAARDAVAGDATVVVLSGDHPLLRAELIDALVETHRRESAAATAGSFARTTARSSGSSRPRSPTASAPSTSRSERSTSAPTPSTRAPSSRHSTRSRWRAARST